MAPLPPIPTSYLNVEPRELVLAIITRLLFCGLGVMLVFPRPNALTSERDWLNILRIIHLPALHRMEERLFRLMDSQAEKQNHSPPTHTSRLTEIDPHMVNM